MIFGDGNFAGAQSMNIREAQVYVFGVNNHTQHMPKITLTHRTIWNK